MPVSLIRCRVLRPFAWLGRIAGVNERLRLHPEDFEHWRQSGHVEAVDDAAPAVPVTKPDRWCAPIER